MLLLIKISCGPMMKCFLSWFYKSVITIILCVMTLSKNSFSLIKMNFLYVDSNHLIRYLNNLNILNIFVFSSNPICILHANYGRYDHHVCSAHIKWKDVITLHYFKSTLNPVESNLPRDNLLLVRDWKGATSSSVSTLISHQANWIFHSISFGLPLRERIFRF
jgi:hypothetical protein